MRKNQNSILHNMVMVAPEPDLVLKGFKRLCNNHSVLSDKAGRLYKTRGRGRGHSLTTLTTF